MTESYGWFCIKCGIRYRQSLCNGNKCPSGHDLTKYGVWVERHESKHGLDVKIIRGNFKLRFFIPSNLDISEYDLADAISDIIKYTSSFSESDWKYKCSLCKYGETTGYYDWKVKCKKGHKWKSIFCKDFERRI